MSDSPDFDPKQRAGQGGTAPWGRSPLGPDTKHLDTAISILKGTGATKRAPRKAQVLLQLMVQGGEYTIQSNGKIVEQGTEGDGITGEGRLQARADAVRRLGKTVVTEVL